MQYLFSALRFLLVLFFPVLLTGQACSGNLGENIFEDGDFGSGAANVIPVDPMIAPGFIYQPSPPPNDGFYTITNDMRQWANIFPAWDAFPDNSNDPNGYMMVVNAAFEPGKFYEQEVTGLCENTEYQFSADVRNVIRPNENALLPNVSFLIDDVEQFNTGFIPENGRWNTYAFSFNTAPGQTTVTLALSNNAPGGNGNDLALDNISFRACGPEARIAGSETLSICEDGAPAALLTVIVGDQYDDPAFQWQQSFDEGETWADLPGENDQTFTHTNLSSGFYYYRYLLANGPANLSNSKCRVVSNNKIVYVVPKRYEIIDTICSGLSFTVGESQYDQTGTSVDTLVSSLGCDSIVTLRLTVVPDPGLEPVFDVNFPSCSDREDGSVQLLSVTGAAGPVFGTVNRDAPQNNPTYLVSGLGEGSYDYFLRDRFGCEVAGAVELVSPNPFTVMLSDDEIIDLGETVRINVEASDSVGSYVWTPAGDIDCPAGCDRVTLVPANSLTLQLNAVSRAGCEASDSVRVTVVKNRRTYFATAFSPNNDGVNDRFMLQGAVPAITLVENLEVFDRWGGQVFAGTELLPNDLAVGWDGRNTKGEDAPAGTYAYTARVRFLDGEVQELRGSVVLVR